jgi:hypothetical protein
VLAVARGRVAEQPLADCLGPPFPFSVNELLETMSGVGLYPMHGPHGITELWDSEKPPQRFLHGVFVRP